MALILRKGIWHWRKMIDGVTLNKSTQTDDKKLAEKIAKKWENEAVKSIKYDGERPATLYEAIDSFLNQRMHLKSYPSAKQHMQHWKNALPNEKMKSLEKHQVQAVVTKRLAEGAGQNTISVFVTYWNALMNHCKTNRLTAGPRLDRVQSKRTRFRIISEQEEADMLAATCPNAKYPGKNPINDARKQDNQDVLICLLHLGARIQEAQNLRWSDVDFASNTILVRRLKNGNDTLLVMTKSLRNVLERRYTSKSDNWVFPTKSGRDTANTGWVNDLVQRAGVDLEAGKITSHTFRHSAATRLLRAGMDIRKVQAFLGHKSINSTLVYLHAMPSEVATQAAAVFDNAK